jgi:hypothetical protein
MYHDTPFGYNLFPFDEQITVQWLATQSKQFDAINTKGNHVWIVIHKIEDTNIVIEAMTDRNYKNIQHFFWHKPNHYVEGPMHRFTPVIEKLSIGFIPDSQSVHWNVSPDPRERPNFVSFPSVASLAKDTAGNIINPTEKPPDLAAHILSIFCKPGGTVLIVGTGAGGCVKGALKAGLNVVGVESDEKQFHQLYSEMNAWVSALAKEKEDAKPKLSNPKKANENAPGKKENKKDAGVAPNLPVVVAAAVVGKCFSCEEPAKEDNPLDECTQCKKMNHVKECMEDIADEKGDLKGLVCAGCKAKLFGGS